MIPPLHALSPVGWVSLVLAAVSLTALVVLRRSGALRGEHGYTLILSGLLILPLLAFAGFATDIGSWYAQASRQQRAADAASLAGVVWLPDEAKAVSVAREIAKENGFDHADSDITVYVSRIGDEQLRVTIEDAEADMFFASIFLNTVDITRRATAEYVLPIPLGSPESRFGTGDLPMGGTPSYLWAAVSGYCVAKEDGDRLLTRYDGNERDGCPPPNGAATYSEDNSSYNAEGYWYVVDVPPAPRPTINLRVYDGGASCGGGPGDNSSLGPTLANFSLHSADLTPLDDTDNPLVTSKLYADGESCGAWNTLYTITSGMPEGRWLLNVRTQDTNYNSGRHNSYGLWAQVGSGTGFCSAISDPTCPRVSARDLLSVSVNDSSGGNAANFFLSEIEDAHEGKTMIIELWDSAEGMEYLQILDPSGDPVNFTWRTVNDDGLYATPTANSTDCSGDPVGPCLDVAGSGVQPGPNRVNNGKFNDRLIQVTVELPTDFSSYPNRWWRIRYKAPSSSLTDRTTWGVKIKGDPVHLVEDVG